jgi:GNAT superfamily N-acetyltransferase
MSFTIRFAAPRDADNILRFIRGLAEYEHLPDEVKVNAAQLRAQMESDAPPFECILAEYDAEAVGCAVFFRNYSTWSGKPGLYLEDLFVLEEYRGRGIGGALMARLARIALGRGWGQMAWAVLDWNTSSQSFYRMNGAQPNEGWKTWRLDGDALARMGRR